MRFRRSARTELRQRAIGVLRRGRREDLEAAEPEGRRHVPAAAPGADLRDRDALLGRQLQRLRRSDDLDPMIDGMVRSGQLEQGAGFSDVWDPSFWQKAAAG